MLGVLLGVVATGCAGSASPSVEGIGARPAALKRLPPEVIRRCASVPTLRGVCPTKVPAAAGELRAFDAHLRGLWGFIVEAGDPGALDGKADPPDLVEVHLIAGDGLGDPIRNLKPAPDLERVARWRWRPWLLDEEVTWGGRTGRVVLWPERPGNITSDHVSFDWSERGTRFRLSLRAWEPIQESVATLEAVVRSVGHKRA